MEAMIVETKSNRMGLSYRGIGKLGGLESRLGQKAKGQGIDTFAAWDSGVLGPLRVDTISNQVLFDTIQHMRATFAQFPWRLDDNYFSRSTFLDRYESRHLSIIPTPTPFAPEPSRK